MPTLRKQIYSPETKDSDKNMMLKLEKLMSFYETSCVVGKQAVDRH
jgi:hypothetical protein